MNQPSLVCGITPIQMSIGPLLQTLYNLYLIYGKSLMLSPLLKVGFAFSFHRFMVNSAEQRKLMQRKVRFAFQWLVNNCVNVSPSF